MKKLSILKRCLCAFIASLMMISYTSCSKDQNKPGSGTSSVQTAYGHKIENYFTSSPFDIPEGMDFIKSIQSSGDRIFFSGYTNAENEKSVMYIYDTAQKKSVAVDTGDIPQSKISNVYLSQKYAYVYCSDSSTGSVIGAVDRESGKIAARTEIKGKSNISSMFTDKDGNLSALLYSKDGSESFLVSYQADDLKPAAKEDLKEKLGLSEGEIISYMITDPDGGYCMFSVNDEAGSVTLYRCDSDFNLNGKWENVTGEMKGEFSGAFAGSDGKVGVITCSHSQMLQVYSVGSYDTNTGELSDIYDPGLSDDSFVLPLVHTEGYDFMYSDGSSLYGCKASEKTSEKILDLVTEVSEDLTKCYSVSECDGSYILHSVSYDDEQELKNTVTDKDGKVLYTIDIKPQKGSNITGLAVFADGKAAVTEINYKITDNKEYSQTCIIHLVDTEGKEISSFEVTGKKSDQEHEGEFNSVHIGKSGNIYIPYNLYNDGSGKSAGRIFVYSSTGESLYTIEGSDVRYIEKVITDGENESFVYTDNSGVSHACLFDSESGTIGKEFSINADAGSFAENVTGCVQGDFCYASSEGIYSFSLSDSSQSEIINWVDSDISFELQNACLVDRDNILCYIWDYSAAANSLCMLKRADEKLLSEIQKKQIITLAGTGITDTIIYDAVLYFNQNSEGYRIQLSDYEKYGGYTDGKLVSGEEKLNKEIEAGQVPDIIIGNQAVNMPAFAASGKFTDLNEFFRKDQQTDKSLLTPNIMNIFSSDGKQYQLPLGYSVRTVAGKASVLGDEPGWTTEQFLEHAAKEQIFYKPGRTELLSVFVSENLSEYVDFIKKTCNFDRDDFRSLLEYIKKNGLTDEEFEKAAEEMNNSNNLDEIRSEYLKRFISGKCVAENVQFGDYHAPAALDNNIIREKTVYKGIPSSSGNGCLVVPDIVAAISSGSGNKDAAWGFLRGLLIDNFQAGLTSTYPVNSDVFDYFVSYAMENESEAGSADADGEYVKSGLLSNQTATTFVLAVSGAERAAVSDSNISEIISEETEKFFSDSQSAEETSRNIQSRTADYLKKL